MRHRALHLPHLVTAAERIRLNGVPAYAALLEAAMAKVVAAERTAGVDLTGFEWITAVAASVFTEAQPACWILEVGLGGRLDATNAFEPDLSIITPVDLDHTELLGTDLSSIATEKAGILRSGRPACFAVQAPAAGAALDAAAETLGAGPVLREGRDWTWSQRDGGVRWEGAGDLVVGPVATGLAGAYQGGNAALALAAAAHVLPALTGGPLEPDRAAHGLAAARMDGRFQLVRLAERRVLVDVAHNPHGIAALAASYGARWGACPAALIGLKDDKDAAGALEALATLSPRLILCPLPGAPGHPVEAMRARCPRPTEVEIVDTWEAGVELLPTVDGGGPPPLICGSHFLVGAVLGHQE